MSARASAEDLAGRTLPWRDVFHAPPVDVAVVPGRAGGDVEVPRFVPGPHYAGNFAEQWHRHRSTQLDSFSGTTISRDFLRDLLDHPLDDLAGAAVLEIGSGAGRFTEHLVEHAQLVVATDLSEAVFVNAARGARNLVLAQADMLDMPPMSRRFDLVLCRGVLQHTPDPMRAIRALYQWVEPGGRVVFDIYSRGAAGRLHPKYLWRPVVRRLFSFEGFVRFLDRATPGMLRMRWRLKPFLPGRLRHVLDYVLPVWDHRGRLPLDEEQLVEWSKLDTLDAMFAAHDHPLEVGAVLKVLQGMDGVEILSFDRRRNFYRTRWTPPAAAPAD